MASTDDFYAQGLIDNRGVYNSLRQKLEQAHKEQERGRPDKAVHHLRAFGHEVEAQAGKHIDAGAASVLLAEAECVIHALEE